MIPRTLDEWTLDVISDLLSKDYYESESYDWKEKLPHGSAQQEKDRLTKTCCAFANTSGGFLVFGVSDNRSAAHHERLIGVDAADDFPRFFGAYPQNVYPSVYFDFRKPSIPLSPGKVIPVMQIPRSWRGPHCMGDSAKGFVFPKRTNTGNGEMAYEEVQGAFLGYYEKRIKLQLLRSEIDGIRRDAENPQFQKVSNLTYYPVTQFEIGVMESVLTDTYTILAERQKLLGCLTDLLHNCRRINGQVRNVGTLLTSHNLMLPQEELTALLHKLSSDVRVNSSVIQNLALEAVTQLDQIINA